MKSLEETARQVREALLARDQAAVKAAEDNRRAEVEDAEQATDRANKRANKLLSHEPSKPEQSDPSAPTLGGEDSQQTGGEAVEVGTDGAR